jgi:uncharacterized protein
MNNNLVTENNDHKRNTLKYDKPGEFDDCITRLYNDDTVRKMDEITHHLNQSCMDHSLFVSYVSYLVCRKFKWDSISAARAGLLHDLFLYDWKNGDEHEGLHGVTHPKVAYKNAEQLCRDKEGENNLSELEKDIILKHMWPLSPKKPSYKESFVVCMADKVCALLELCQIYKRLKFRRTTSAIIKNHGKGQISADLAA